ncbi:MAG: cyclodeaminase/cyclohydrolase family protein, partial [Betaproteobacteria bacterium]|nr:cyclodeaminase/cyclohydrolase family protein [Betaproteobacteria bacterium]
IGKKGYELVEAEMKSQLAESEALRAQLTDMVADDVGAFNQLMAAYRMPKETDEQKAVRHEAVQAGLKQATRVPLNCAKTCAAVIRVAQRSAEHGNLNVISDTGAGVLALQAALRSAALNVYMNTPFIKDPEFVTSVLEDLNALMTEYLPRTEAVYAKVRSRMG